MIPPHWVRPGRWASLLLSLAALASPLPGQEKSSTPAALVGAARSQVGKTVIYEGSYQSLPYPGGYVPLERGVCTVVIIRALRRGIQLDL